MASQKITELTALSAPAATDLLVVVDVSEQDVNLKTKSLTVGVLLELLYPVGALFFNGSAGTDPAQLLGFGTWQRFGEGRMIVSQLSGDADFDTAGETGGAKTHVLSVAELPAHTHAVTSQTATTGSATSYEHGTLDTSSAEAEATEVTGSTGGGAAHNNMPPFIVAYVWIRTV